MIPQFGQTRSDIRRNHALLTPESHEWITDPDWAWCRDRLSDQSRHGREIRDGIGGKRRPV